MSQYAPMDKIKNTVAAAPAAPTFEQWRLLALLVASVFINYIDRSNLSVSAEQISKELFLSPTQMGMLLSGFFRPVQASHTVEWTAWYVTCNACARAPLSRI